MVEHLVVLYEIKADWKYCQNKQDERFLMKQAFEPRMLEQN